MSTQKGQGQRPVVQALIALMQLRSTHPAFDGEFTAEAEGEMSCAWRGNPLMDGQF